MFITLKEQVDMSKYFRYDVIEVSASGIRSVLIKAVGKREVTVTLKGLYPNTSDTIVIEYLEKFGKVVSSKVVHCVYSEGPLRGFKNGDRCYRMEINPSVYLGSYNILDGQKVFLRYPGQMQTCARCLKPSRDCRGKGLARVCEAEGGNKEDFADYVTMMWEAIGYSPEGVLDPSTDFNQSEVSPQFGGESTPVKSNSSPDKFKGVSIKQFPREMDHGEILEFLVNKGLPELNKESITIGENGTVTARNLSNEVCLDLIKSIHGKTYFSMKNVL